MHAISSYRGNRPIHTQTPTHPQTGPITVHCDAASVQCNEYYSFAYSGSRSVVAVTSTATNR